MLKITIALPSGRSHNLSLKQTSKVGHLRAGAEAFARQPFLRLVTAEGRILLMELNLGHGAMQSWAVTAPQSKNSSGMSSRFKPHEVRLLPSLQMDQSLHGAIQDVVVIALKLKNSSGMYSTFSPLHGHLLRS
jgi:hypothetical protein